MQYPDELKKQILSDPEFMRQIIAAYFGGSRTKRLTIMRFRINEGELLYIQQSAKNEDVTVSQWIRSRLRLPENVSL